MSFEVLDEQRPLVVPEEVDLLRTDDQGGSLVQHQPAFVEHESVADGARREPGDGVANSGGAWADVEAFTQPRETIRVASHSPLCRISGPQRA